MSNTKSMTLQEWRATHRELQTEQDWHYYTDMLGYTGYFQDEDGSVWRVSYGEDYLAFSLCNGDRVWREHRDVWVRAEDSYAVDVCRLKEDT